MKSIVVLLSGILIIASCQSTAATPSSQLPAVMSPSAQAQVIPPAPTSPPAQGNTSPRLSLTVAEPEDTTLVKTEKIRVSGTTSPDAEVRVNDQFVYVDTIGRFTTTVLLETGPNAIEVNASDGSGNEEFRILTVIYLP